MLGFFASDLEWVLPRTLLDAATPRIFEFGHGAGFDEFSRELLPFGVMLIHWQAIVSKRVR